MSKTIHLIRHGRSAYSARATWVSAAGFQRWRDAYDAAGIDPTDVAPAALLSVVAGSDVIVCSDLRRAVESAHRIAPLQPALQSALLRETPLAVPAWIPVRLPVSAWDALAHISWGLEILQKVGPSPDDRHRADQTIDWLAQHDGAAVISVVTHGVFRRILANRALELGWREVTRSRSYKCWSVWSFVRVKPWT